MASAVNELLGKRISRAERPVWIAEAMYQSRRTAESIADDINNYDIYPELKGFAEVRGTNIIVRNSTKEKAQEAKEILKKTDSADGILAAVRVIQEDGDGGWEIVNKELWDYHEHI